MGLMDKISWQISLSSRLKVLVKFKWISPRTTWSIIPVVDRWACKFAITCRIVRASRPKSVRKSMPKRINPKLWTNRYWAPTRHPKRAGVERKVTQISEEIQLSEIRDVPFRFHKCRPQPRNSPPSWTDLASMTNKSRRISAKMLFPAWVNRWLVVLWGRLELFRLGKILQDNRNLWILALFQPKICREECAIRMAILWL